MNPCSRLAAVFLPLLLLLPAAATIRRLEMVWQPLFLPNADVEAEIVLQEVPVATYYSMPEVGFSAIALPFEAPVTDARDEEVNVNLAAAFGIRVIGGYGEEDNELLVQIDASEATVPEGDYPFTIEEVVNVTRRCAARTFGSRDTQAFETLKIVVIQPGEEFPPGEDQAAAERDQATAAPAPEAAEDDEAVPAEADPREVHRVNSIEQLIAALGSDRIIELAQGDYNFSEAEGVAVDCGRWEEVFDGWQLVIGNVANLTLRAAPELDRRPRLLIEPRYADVLHFEGSQAIRVEGLTLGHTPEKGSCTGSVIELNQCGDIELADLDLFGCGMDGLSLHGVDGLLAESVHIHSCSYGIATAQASRELTFRDCVFTDNREFYGFDFDADVEAVRFEDCLFLNNEYDHGGGLFGRIPKEQLTLERCSIHNS